MALAGLVFFIQSHWGISERLPYRQWARASAFGVIGIAFLYAVYHRAVEEGGVSLAILLLYTAPVHIALAETVIFNVPMTLQKGTGSGVPTSLT